MSDPTATVAQPFAVLPRRDLEGPAERLVRMVREHEVDEVVVGLPRTMGGEEGPMAAVVTALAQHLADVLDVPVKLFDERLTSVAARRVMAGCGRRRYGDAGAADRVAAAIILQNYLDRSRGGAHVDV